jgi:hypothetical protein
MAKEPDQTKWVGIRPTDPSEDIPTISKKLAPAIGDLQAVKERCGQSGSAIGIDCSVNGWITLPQVTAGEIWVVTNMTATNKTSLCDIIFRPRIGDDWREIKSIYSVEPGLEVSWNGLLVFIRPDYIRCHFEFGGANDNIYLYTIGYKIGIY